MTYNKFIEEISKLGNLNFKVIHDTLIILDDIVGELFYINMRNINKSMCTFDTKYRIQLQEETGINLKGIAELVKTLAQTPVRERGGICTNNYTLQIWSVV